MKLDPPVTINELPIPEGSQPSRLWTGQMLELAAHIGPYATLQLVDRLGGQTIPVPKDPARNRASAVVGPKNAEILSKVYGGERLSVPVGHKALHEARRAPVLAAIREGRLTIEAAVPILRMKRSTISRLINHSAEGEAAVAWLGAAPRRVDPRQLDLLVHLAEKCSD